MRAILVDDERFALEELEYELKGRDVEVIGKFTDSVEALEEIIRLSPDAVFLDIDMPELDGITMADEILQRSSGIQVVFVTAYNEYALRAFELNAIDYVVKPVSAQRLDLTIRKLSRQKGVAGVMENIRETIRQEVAKNDFLKIPVRRNDRIFLLCPEEIDYMAIEDSGTSIFTGSGETYNSHDSLNHWEDKLKKYHFFRCHKSFIVNLSNVEQVVPWFNNTFVLKFKLGRYEVPVGRTYIRDFKQLVNI